MPRLLGRRAGSEHAPVLFYAERDPLILFGAWCAVVLIMLPFALAMPDQFLSGVCLSLLLAWICHRTFRFELTSHHLVYRPNAFAAAIRVPLADILTVHATDLLGRSAGALGAPPRRGHVLVRTPRLVVVVKSILDPGEAAEAIETLRRRQR